MTEKYKPVDPEAFSRTKQAINEGLKTNEEPEAAARNIRENIGTLASSVKDFLPPLLGIELLDLYVENEKYIAEIVQYNSGGNSLERVIYSYSDFSEVLDEDPNEFSRGPLEEVAWLEHGLKVVDCIQAATKNRIPYNPPTSTQ